MRRSVNKDYVLKINRDFHDQVEADNYDQRMGISHDANATHKILSELERIAGCPLPKGGTLVDVAAGTGNLAIKLASTGWYRQVMAVDISERSLECARKNASAAGVRINALVSDMLPLPLQDNSMDLLVGCAVLHHLPAPEEFMAEVQRVLKPGSRFIIIGEPTSFGACAIDLCKSPLVLINNCLKILFKTEQTYQWDHDNIDVHNFSLADSRLLTRGFEQVSVVVEGFAEPIIDQGLFAPLRYIFSQSVTMKFLLSLVQKGLAWLDRNCFNPLLPNAMKVSLKLTGVKANLELH